MSIKKLIFILVISLLIVNIVFLPYCYAIDFIKHADDFTSKSDATNDVINETNLINASNTIYKTLLLVAICVSVVVGAILGINFILGSVEGKAKVQEALVPYIIGCFVAFGAFTIWGIVVNIGNNL